MISSHSIAQPLNQSHYLCSYVYDLGILKQTGWWMQTCHASPHTHTRCHSMWPEWSHVFMVTRPVSLLIPHLFLSPELWPWCPSQVYFRDYEYSALRHLKRVWLPGSSPQRVQFLRFLPNILILKRKAQISLAAAATVTIQPCPPSVTLPTCVASSAWIPWSLCPLLPSGFGVFSSHERMFPGTECLGFFSQTHHQDPGVVAGILTSLQNKYPGGMATAMGKKNLKCGFHLIKECPFPKIYWNKILNDI